MLVDFTVAFFPVIELLLGDADPRDNLLGGQFGAIGPALHVIDHGVTRIMGSPFAV